MMILNGQEFLKPIEVAKMMNVTLQTFYNWKRRDNFPLEAVKIGGRFFYRKNEVEAYINKLIGQEIQP